MQLGEEFQGSLYTWWRVPWRTSPKVANERVELMNYTGECAGSRKIDIAQGFEQAVWVAHRPELIKHMLSNGFENIPDLASVREIFLIVNSAKLPKK